MTVQDVLDVLKGARRQGSGWRALCPAHDDQNPSLNIAEKDGRILLHCHAGCSFETVRAAIRSLGGGRVTGTGSGAAAPDSPAPKVKGTGDRTRDGKQGTWIVAAEYNYEDDGGRFLSQVVRLNRSHRDGPLEKTFRPRRRPRNDETPAADGWVYNLDGVPRVLYNLRELAGASLVYVVEGEKDVETLRPLGLVATCNPGGAGKWRAEYNHYLRDKTVVILPDNDEPGRQHAEKVAASLDGVAAEVLVIHLPDLPAKGDVTDFVQAGGTADDLMDLVQRQEPWKPTSRPPEKGFHFTTVAALIAEPEEEMSYIWDRILPTRGFSILSAKPKAGKSTVARALCKAIASGIPFLGRSTRTVPIIYLCFEEKRSEVGKAFRRMGVSSENILVHTGVTPDNALERLRLAIVGHSAGLVIIDPLSRILRVDDFNAYGAMTAGLEPFVDLARLTGCHILALHHDSKRGKDGGDALLGSTALFGAVDSHIQIAIRKEGRVISSTQRYGEDLAESIIVLDKDTASISTSGSLKEARLSKAKDAVLECIGAGETLEQQEIKSRVSDFTGGDVSIALKRLVEEQTITQTGKGKRGDPFFYARAA